MVRRLLALPASPVTSKHSKILDSKIHSLENQKHTLLTPAFFLRTLYKMAANSASHPARAGYNQSGGAYFIVTANLDNAKSPNTAPAYINTLVSRGSNSGGAWVPPTLALVSMSTVLGLTPTDAHYSFASSIVQAGSLLKDMGRTVVSSGRTFRKFAPVVGGTADRTLANGVAGSVGSAPNAGYGTFYLEVGREGNTYTAAPAPIARYF